MFLKNVKNKVKELRSKYIQDKTFKICPTFYNRETCPKEFRGAHPTFGNRVRNEFRKQGTFIAMGRTVIDSKLN